jgi:isopenicillin N synthase-like dioxygenase
VVVVVVVVVMMMGCCCGGWVGGWDHQIVNHGVPGECMDEILKVHMEFFHLPMEEKMKYYSDDMRAPFKYGVGQVAKAYDEQVWKDHLTLLYQEKMDTSTWPKVPERFVYAYTHILSNPSF